MAMFSVVFAALAVVVASASAALDRPVVCFRNVEGNPRTASLFERETLNEFSHSYLYLMEAVANNSGFACDHIVLLVEHNFNNPSRTAETARQMAQCTHDTPCIITGDEMCSYRDGSHPHVIARFYYSSDYKTTPVFGLGPILGFKISRSEWPKGPREYLFSFKGSRGTSAQKKDRDTLMEVMDTATFTGKHNVEITGRVKVEPHNDAETQRMVDQYRKDLLSSSFVLDPAGDHDDCFRFWEAIKAGAIPVYAKRKWGLRKDGDIKTLLQRFHGGRIKTSESMVEADSDKPFVCPDPMDNVLRTNPPVVVLESWNELPDYMNSVTEKEIAQMRSRLTTWEREWWRNQTLMADNIIAKAFGE